MLMMEDGNPGEGRAGPSRLTVPGGFWSSRVTLREGLLFSGNRCFAAPSTSCTCNEWRDD